MLQLISSFRKLILAVGDFALLYLALFLVLTVRYGDNFDSSMWSEHMRLFLPVFAVWILIFYLFNLYEGKSAKNSHRFYLNSAKAIFTAVILTVIFLYLAITSSLTPQIAPKTNLVLTATFYSMFFFAWRSACNLLFRSNRFLNNTIFIGVNKEAQDIINILSEHPQLGYKIIKVFDYNDVLNIDIFKIAQELNINTVVHSNQHQSESEKQIISKMLYNLIPLGVSIVELPKFYAEITKKIPISIIGETWFLENLIETEKKPYETGKRTLDILLAILLAAVFLLFAPLIVLAIRIDSRGGAFYTQTRVGKNGKVFSLLKFRTMVKNAEAHGAQWTSTGDTRVTRVGGFLRKSRIDELPQLWNVIKGDMSFAGPRPERPEFVGTLEKAIPYYQMRHLVRPGLTGWAQINQPHGGASVEDSLEKLQYDLYYIKNRDLILDLDVMLKTIPVVLKREGH